MISREKFHRHGKNITVIRKIIPNMIVYAVIATDSVAARGLVNGWCLPRSGRRDILSRGNYCFHLHKGNFADNSKNIFTGGDFLLILAVF